MFSCRQNAFLLSPDSRQERTTRSICSSVCFMITVFHKAKHKLPSCKDVLARVLTVQTSSGPVVLETSRDRNGTFEPELVKKRETVLADTLEGKILGMYGLGMSFRDISSHLKEMYDADISHSTLSAITDRIIPAIKEWQARPLESLYCIVWLDAMHYKVKDQGKIVSRAVYHILGINQEGRKELLGMYVSESEG